MYAIVKHPLKNTEYTVIRKECLPELSDIGEEAKVFIGKAVQDLPPDKILRCKPKNAGFSGPGLYWRKIVGVFETLSEANTALSAFDETAHRTPEKKMKIDESGSSKPSHGIADTEEQQAGPSKAENDSIVEELEDNAVKALSSIKSSASVQTVLKHTSPTKSASGKDSVALTVSDENQQLTKKKSSSSPSATQHDTSKLESVSSADIIRILSNTVKEKDITIETLTATIKQKDNTINALLDSFKQRDNVIAVLTTSLSHQNGTLEHMRSLNGSLLDQLQQHKTELADARGKMLTPTSDASNLSVNPNVETPILSLPSSSYIITQDSNNQNFIIQDDADKKNEKKTRYAVQKAYTDSCDGDGRPISAEILNNILAKFEPDERYPAITNDYVAAVFQDSSKNNMKSDSKLVRTLFRKLFTDEEIIRGNISGENSRGSKKEDKPEKYDEGRMDFIFQIFRNRLAILAQSMPVTLERMERKTFNNYVRDASNPLKRLNRESKN